MPYHRGASREGFAWYRRWADEDPAWPALVGHGGETVSYGELAEWVTDEAAGLPPGSRVALAAPANSVEWIVRLLATVVAGGQVVLGNGSLPRDGRERAGFWLFTSGTTATPEPRFRSVDTAATMLERLRARLPPAVAKGRPSGVCIVPLNHGFGLLNALLLVQYLGGTVHLGPPDDAGAIAALVQDRRIQMLYAWPKDFAALADHGVWTGATSLRWCVSSSSALVPEVAERFAARTGRPVRQQYGTTETGPLSVDSDDPPDPRCVGRALDGIDLRIVDERGEELGVGEEGRVAVAGDKAPFYPGDRGWKDDTGRLFLTGREHPFSDERAR